MARLVTRRGGDRLSVGTEYHAGLARIRLPYGGLACVGLAGGLWKARGGAGVGLLGIGVDPSATRAKTSVRIWVGSRAGL